METNHISEYPELTTMFEKLRNERCEEILEQLKKNDEKYANLIKIREIQSAVLRKKLKDEITYEFEQYMDLVYEQETIELDIVYIRAFNDAIVALKELKLLP